MTESTKRQPTRRARSLVIGVAVAAIGALAAAPAVLANTRAAEGRTDHGVAAGQANVTIEIPEVSCAGCSLEARKAVKSVGGVVSLGEGDPKNRLVVTYEPAAGRPEAYVEALHKAGFAKARDVAKN